MLRAAAAWQGSKYSLLDLLSQILSVNIVLIELEFVITMNLLFELLL